MPAFTAAELEDRTSSGLILWEMVLTCLITGFHTLPKPPTTLFQTPPSEAANATVPTPANHSSLYNGGSVYIPSPNFALPFTSWAQKAFNSLGYQNISGFSDGELLRSQYAPSVLQPQSNHIETSESSYLEAAFASDRMNLIFYSHTLALQVMFLGKKTATAVKMRSGSDDNFLTARKEIVSSAGAFQSPQLLMASGIGPAQTLAQYNISVVADHPGLGQNLWDHVDIEVTWKVGVVGFNTLMNLTFADQQTKRYQNEPESSILHSSTPSGLPPKRTKSSHCKP